jgi:hypothetical protein
MQEEMDLAAEAKDKGMSGIDVWLNLKETFLSVKPRIRREKNLAKKPSEQLFLTPNP